MNRRRIAFLAPLFAVLAMLLGLTEAASAAFNPAAQNPHYGNFLLRESEVSTSEWLQLADPIKEKGEWIYDGALGVPVYVRQNPWTMFDPLGLESFVFPSQYAQSSEFRQGFQRGAGTALVAGTAITVGVAATVWTGGAAAPLIAEMGMGAVATSLTTAAVSGAAGGGASQMTSNLLTGQSVGNNVPEAMAMGAVVNMGAGVLGQTVQGFNLGVREGTAIATAKQLATQTAAGGAPGGAASAMVTAEGQVFTGLSKNAGGGAVSPAVSGLYGSARTTCAEARVLTAMEQAGVNPQGAVSASASVGVKGLPAGTPMPACEKACAPVLKNAGIGDAVAGTSPTLAPMKPAVSVKPTTEDEK